jgi:hypothetical protein
MSLAIRFQVLPPDLELRVKTALQALVDGKMTDLEAGAFFFKFFFNRLDPMYRENPPVANTIKEAVKNQLVGLQVPNLVDITLNITTISDLNFAKGIAFKTPTMIFNDIKVVEDIILAHSTLPQVLMEKKLKIKKLADILKWLAPIATIQTEETLQRVRDEELSILIKLLEEIGY